MDPQQIQAALAPFIASMPLEDQRRLQAHLRAAMTHGDRGPPYESRPGASPAVGIWQPADPVARALIHAVCDAVFTPGSVLRGAEHVASVSGPLTFVANHLSFADANGFEYLLRRRGCGTIADRLTVLIGPKVRDESYRQIASLCYGTIETPQSKQVASGKARISAREVARHALKVIKEVNVRHAAGDHMLIFVEGTRSRHASMQRALPAVARYLDDAEVVLVPVGITGTEAMVPIGEEGLHPACVTVTLGAPLLARDLRARCGRDRHLLMNVVGLAIAEGLPPAYRGVYADDAELESARAILRAVRHGVAPRTAVNARSSRV